MTRQSTKKSINFIIVGIALVLQACGTGEPPAPPEDSAPTAVQSDTTLVARRGEAKQGTAGQGEGKSGDALPLGDPENIRGETAGERKQEAGAKKVTSNGCYGTSEQICAVEKEILRLTNELRAGEGLSPLDYSMEISHAARDWSAKQHAAGQISHDGFPAKRQEELDNEFGEAHGAVIESENVADYTNASASVEDTARIFVDAWWNSEGHKENILRPATHIGIGIYFKDGVFVATQLFGRETAE